MPANTFFILAILFVFALQNNANAVQFGVASDKDIISVSTAGTSENPILEIQYFGFESCADKTDLNLHIRVSNVRTLFEGPIVTERECYIQEMMKGSQLIPITLNVNLIFEFGRLYETARLTKTTALFSTLRTLSKKINDTPFQVKIKAQSKKSSDYDTKITTFLKFSSEVFKEPNQVLIEKS